MTGMVEVAEDYKVICGDCLEVLKEIPDCSVDAVICDPPYGVLNRRNEHVQWDNALPMHLLWKHYKRIVRTGGVVILFGQGLFTAMLMQSNPKQWKYNLIWDKVLKTGFLNSAKMPLRRHEDICVFYDSQPVYNPQMEKCEPHKRNHSKGNRKAPGTNRCYGNFMETPTIISDEKFPSSIVTFSKEHKRGSFFHPTQKPVALLEYLIKTYTNEGMTVLDNTMGSGSTGVACINTGRKFIGIELDEGYFEIAGKRIKDAVREKKEILF